MAMVRDHCICVGKVEYSETSQILNLFSRDHGLVRVIAKGAHRRTKAGASKFDGGIDLLDGGDAVFSFDPARELVPLTEWSLTEGRLDLRKNLRAIYLGLYSAELVSRLFEEHDPHRELFDRLSGILVELCTARLEEAFLSFELDLLKESGYLPELFSCVECGIRMDGTGPSYFSPDRGGVICARCEGTIPDRQQLDGRLLRLLQGILRLPRGEMSVLRLPRLTRHQTDPINSMVVAHIEHRLGKRLRLPKYMLGR